MQEKGMIVKKVSILGLLANIVLLFSKIFIGVAAKSQAMIADGINSAGDIFASFMSFWGAKVSSKPKDKDHPYGHGKAEYIFSLFISIVMIIVSAMMMKSSIVSIINKSQIIFSKALLLVCFLVITVKILLYIYTKSKYKLTSSILIKASMEDHRNDVFVTCGTLIGVISGYFGLHFVDGIIGVGISFWILLVGFKLFLEAYRILMDTNITSEMEEEILQLVNSNKEIKHVDSIKGKPVGQNYVIILKISMDSSTSLKDSHNFSGKLKSDILNKFNYVDDVVIHINPDE